MNYQRLYEGKRPNAESKKPWEEEIEKIHSEIIEKQKKEQMKLIKQKKK